MLDNSLAYLRNGVKCGLCNYMPLQLFPVVLIIAIPVLIKQHIEEIRLAFHPRYQRCDAELKVGNTLDKHEKLNRNIVIAYQREYHIDLTGEFVCLGLDIPDIVEKFDKPDGVKLILRSCKQRLPEVTGIDDCLVVRFEFSCFASYSDFDLTSRVTWTTIGATLLASTGAFSSCRALRKPMRRSSLITALFLIMIIARHLFDARSIVFVIRKPS